MTTPTLSSKLHELYHLGHAASDGLQFYMHTQIHEYINTSTHVFVHLQNHIYKCTSTKYVEKGCKVCRCERAHARAHARSLSRTHAHKTHKHTSIFISPCQYSQRRVAKKKCIFAVGKKVHKKCTAFFCCRARARAL